MESLPHSGPSSTNSTASTPSVAAELADIDPHARADLVDSFERWEAPIRAGLARMRARGDLRPDTDTDALALLAALQGGLLLGYRVRGHKQALTLRAQYRECPVPLAGLAAATDRQNAVVPTADRRPDSRRRVGLAEAAQPTTGHLPSWGFNSVSARLIRGWRGCGGSAGPLHRLSGPGWRSAGLVGGVGIAQDAEQRQAQQSWRPSGMGRTCWPASHRRFARPYG
jgi:hypothetical protein